MAIIKNNKKVIGIYKGQSPVKKAYRGSSLMYSSTIDYDLVCTYNVTATTSPTVLLSNADHSELVAMEVDGIQMPLVTSYAFSTTGEHVVKYKLTDSTKITNNHFYQVSALKDVTINYGITSIGTTSFRYNYFSSITIPDSVTEIGGSTFEYCNKLTSIDIPDSVTSIGSGAFSGASALKTIRLSENLTKINENVFANCSNLESLIIPDSVTSIANNQIKSKQLVYLYVGASVEEINTSFWLSGNSNINVVVSENNTTYDSRGGCNAIIETAANNLKYGFASTVIPDSVTSIAINAFSNNSCPSEIVIPDSVTSVGDYAFYNSSELEKITIGNGITDLSTVRPFRLCSGLKTIIINNKTAPAISSSTFNDIASNGVLYYPSGSDYSTWLSTDSYYLGYYNWTSEVTYDVTATFNVTDTSTPTHIYSGKAVTASSARTTSSLTTMYIDDEEVTPTVEFTFPTTGEHTVGYNFVDNTQIPNGAFYQCSGMTSLKIRDNITSIGSSVFSSCSGLTSVTIPSSVTSIGGRTFYNCTSLPVIDNIRYADTYLVEAVDKTLSTYSIKEGTKWLGSSAFANCSGLTSIDIPSSVINIGNAAFMNCTSLTSVTIPDSVTSIGSSAFEKCSSLTELVIPDSVTSIGSSAFEKCSSLTELVIPDSVITIGTSTSTVLANSGNTSLTAVTIGSGVTNLQAGILKSVPNLKYLKIGDGITSLTGTWGTNGYNPTSSGYFAVGAKSPFQGCTALEEVILPENLQSMSGPVFMYCDQLESITIPSSVTALTDYSYSQGGSYGCFQNCTSLREVTFEGNTAPSIGEHTFPNVNAGTVYYPCGSDYSSVMDKLSMWTDGCTGSSNLSSIYIRAEYTSAGQSAVDQDEVVNTEAMYGINPVQAIVWYNESGEVIDSGASDYYITTSSNVLSPNYAKIYLNPALSEYEDITTYADNLMYNIDATYEVVDESGAGGDSGDTGDDIM